MKHTTFLAPAKSSIRLCKGRTYEEYIIRLNATKAPICDLCEYLKISFDELRKIYDRVYNVPLAKIGRLKRQLVFCGCAPTDWGGGEIGGVNN